MFQIQNDRSNMATKNIDSFGKEIDYMMFAILNSVPISFTLRFLATKLFATRQQITLLVSFILAIRQLSAFPLLGYTHTRINDTNNHKSFFSAALNIKTPSAGPRYTIRSRRIINPQASSSHAAIVMQITPADRRGY